MTSKDQVTAMLHEWNNGDPSALEQLMPIVYSELRSLARAQLRRETPLHTLQPTAVIHELYLKLVDQEHVEWRGRAHFLGVAARMMRRILIDHARVRDAVKRGKQFQRITFEDFAIELDDPADLLALDTALDRLAELDERQARVVELRFFGGMTVPEVAAALEISEPTVKREWASARAWLRVEIEGGGR